MVEEMVQDQLDQMVDMLKTDDEPTVKVLEEPPVEDPPAEDPPAEEPPKEEPPAEPPAEPSAEEPPTEEPSAEPPVEVDIEQIKKDNEELRKRIDDLSAPKSEPEPEPEPASAEPEPIVLDEVDFIGDADMDEVTRDPKEFNKLLNKVFAQGVNVSRDRISEGVLRSIPDIVKSNITMVTNLRKASDDFYDANEDLKPFKKVVAVVFEERFAANPGKKYSEILDGVADDVRSRLELHKKAVNPEPEPDPNNPPKLPRKKGQPRQPSDKPNTNPLLAEIDKMNESI